MPVRSESWCVDIAEDQVKATSHLCLVKSASPETCAVQQVTKRRREVSLLALRMVLPGLPPGQGHAPVTLG